MPLRPPRPSARKRRIRRAFRAHTGPRTGEVHQVPRGIDPGFQNNAGTIGRAEFIKPPEVEAKAAAKAIARPRLRRTTPSPSPPSSTARPSAPKPDLDAPGAGAAHTDHTAETAAVFRKRPDYRTAKDLPGKASGTPYRLRLPKGSRAVVENEVEQEVLLKPGTKYRVAEIVDNADKGADRLYKGPSRVYIFDVVEGTDGAG